MPDYQSDPPAQAPDSKVRRILIVDDDPKITGSLKSFFEKIARFEVRIVNDSSLAVASARSFQPEAIILDVQMPGMDGGAVAAALRAEPILGEIPIIFCTGLLDAGEYGQKEIVRDGMRFLPKPISPTVLLEALHRLLGLRETGILNEATLLEASNPDTIDLTHWYNRLYWRHRFSATDEFLREAVEAVGTEPEAVRTYIEQRRVRR
jgi:CheY-like chemotaxis protein